MIAASGDYCAVVFSEKSDSRSSSSSSSSSSSAPPASGKSSDPTAAGTGTGEVFVIQLRNAIGAVVDTKRINFCPKMICMGAFHFAAANERTVYTWQFQSQVSKSGFASATVVNDDDASSSSSNSTSSSSSSSSVGLSGKSKERMFDIENINIASAQPPETFRMFLETVPEPITCLALSDKFLVVGRKDGSLIRFSLPHLSPENSYDAHCELYLPPSCGLYLVCVCVCVCGSGVMSVLDLEARIVEGEEDDRIPIGTHFGKKMAIEKRSVGQWGSAVGVVFLV